MTMIQPLYAAPIRPNPWNPGGGGGRGTVQPLYAAPIEPTPSPWPGGGGGIVQPLYAAPIEPSPSPFPSIPDWGSIFNGSQGNNLQTLFEQIDQQLGIKT